MRECCCKAREATGRLQVFQSMAQINTDLLVLRRFLAEFLIIFPSAIVPCAPDRKPANRGGEVRSCRGVGAAVQSGKSEIQNEGAMAAVARPARPGGCIGARPSYFVG